MWAFRTCGGGFVFSVNLANAQISFSSTNYHRFENDGVRLWNGGILSKWVGQRLVVGGGAHVRWTVTFSWEEWGSAA